jgi:hypothetical protein
VRCVRVLTQSRCVCSAGGGETDPTVLQMYIYDYTTLRLYNTDNRIIRLSYKCTFEVQLRRWRVFEQPVITLFFLPFRVCANLTCTMYKCTYCTLYVITMSIEY